MTQRWIRSVRGSSPKIVSESVTEPGLFAVERGDFHFHDYAPSFVSFGRGGFGSRSRRTVRGFTELAGLRRILRQRLLDGVTHHDPTALGARHRAFDEDQAALDIGLTRLRRFSVVMRSTPIWPGIFLFLNVLPGS